MARNWVERVSDSRGSLFFFVVVLVLFNNGSRIDCIATISDHLQLDVLRK